MIRPLSERFVKTIFLLLGVGILLPWNAYISAKHYFVSRICNEKEDEDNYNNIGQEIEMWFSIVYNGAGVLSLVVVILVQHLADGNKYNKRIKSVKSFIFKNTTNLSVSMMSSKTSSLKTIDTTHSTDHTIWYMVIIPLTVYLIVFAISTLLVFLVSIPTRMFMFLTLTGLFICGVSTAVAGSGIVGTAGLFPANLGVNPYFNGQAIGGLLVSCANLIASYVDGPESFMVQYCPDQPSSEISINSTSVTIDEDNQAASNEETVCIPYGEISLATAGYFSMGGFILVACMVGYNYIDRYKQLVRKNSFGGNSDEVDIDGDYGDNNDWNNNTSSQSLIEGPMPRTQKLRFDQSNGNNLSNVKMIPTKMPISYQNNSTNMMNQVRRQNSTDTDTSETTQSLTVSVWTSIRGTALSLFFTYFCTLAIFPVWTSELISTNQCNSTSRIRNDLFVPLSFVIFNGGDLVGRYISSAIEFEKISNLSSKLVWASMARIYFFLCIFLSCEAQRNRYEDRIVIDSDLYSWSIQFLFAITNGILTNVAFCYAPTLIENRTKPQQVASAVLNLAMTLGLTVGSFFSVPFLKFASGKWH
jgi:hypothetical protein